jgi:hypothetical protein
MTKVADEDAMVLASEEVSSRLGELDGWAAQDNKLVKGFNFDVSGGKTKSEYP